MSERNLVIVGNGFDLVHNLETKWSNFKEYLSQFDTELLYYLESCIECDSDLWSDFEKSLGRINRRIIYTDKLSDFDMIRNDEDEGNNHQMADSIRHIEDLIIDGTKRSLNDWILSIDVNVDPICSIQRILQKAQVITFNYTSTLEETYNISTNNIIYLHGKAVDLPAKNFHDYFEPDPVPEIVIGHGDDVDEIDVGSFANSMSDEIVLDEVETEGHRDVLEELRKDTTKYMPRLKPILDSMNEYDNIYIIGHSLSDIDAPYFHALASYISNHTRIIVTYKAEFEQREEKINRVKYLFPVQAVIAKEIEEL